MTAQNNSGIERKWKKTMSCLIFPSTVQYSVLSTDREPGGGGPGAFFLGVTLRKTPKKRFKIIKLKCLVVEI